MNAMDPQESGTETPKPSFSLFRWIITGLLYGFAALLLAGVGAAITAFVIYDYVTEPGVAGPDVEVMVPQGATGRDIAKILVEQGLLEHEFFFRLAIQLEGPPQAIRTGAYRLHRGQSAREILKEMYKGPSRQLLEDQYRVTIPEGLTIRQAAALTHDPDGFIAAAKDPDLIAKSGIEAESLEGFLMPNTYFFDKEPDAKAIVTRMLEQFDKEYRKLTAEFPGAERLNKKRIVTIASLIEEETKVDNERARVARVIYNRIDEGMRLQLDSTLQFALNKYGRRMLYTDREIDSPYNTYLNTGLPPGPISNPGVASLRAAMQPAQGKWRYFVSNADGKTHTFSVTEEEHLKAVARFRREIAPQREALQSQQPADTEKELPADDTDRTAEESR